jgi:hypothetical protein
MAVFFIEVVHACSPMWTDPGAVNADADKNWPSESDIQSIDISSSHPIRHDIRLTPLHWQPNNKSTPG